MHVSALWGEFKILCCFRDKTDGSFLAARCDTYKRLQCGRSRLLSIPAMLLDSTQYLPAAVTLLKIFSINLLICVRVCVGQTINSNLPFKCQTNGFVEHLQCRSDGDCGKMRLSIFVHSGTTFQVSREKEGQGLQVNKTLV